MMTTTNAACRQKLKTNEPDRLCVVTRPQHRHTHRGDGGVNCNSAALTGPSLNNRKAEMCQKYKKKTVTQDTWPLKPAPPFTHMMRSLHGSTQPEEPHFNIHYYYYYHDYNIHSLIRTPGLQTSTQSHVSFILSSLTLLLAVFATEWTCDGFIQTAAESSTWTADLRCNTVQISCACA